MLPSAAPGLGHAIFAHGGLQAGELRVGPVLDRVLVRRRVGPDDELQLARVLPPGGEQAVARPGDRRVLGAADHARRLGGDPLPQGRRRVQQEQVHVAVLGQRPQDAAADSRAGA